MDVRLLYFDGCPNWRVAEQRLREAVALTGADIDVVLLNVVTSEDAERLSFRGSPTVLINGTDPFAEPDAPVGLSCRLYRTDAGLAGSPTVQQLMDVLRGS